MDDDHATSSGPADQSLTVHAVLVPGFWLGAWAWQEVESPLRKAGIEPHPVTLPGASGTGTSGVTLDDRIDAVSTLVNELAGDIVLVGHSGGGAVVQGVIDRQPLSVRRVVYVDSGPLADGASLMPDAEADVPLPSWEALAAAGSSVEGMDTAALATFRRRAVNEPVGVVRARVRVTDERRLDGPASVICASFNIASLRRMIESGALPSELLSVRDVRYVELPTGHWPMFSRAADLAAVLIEEVRRT